jgi:hypothetical protein
MKKYFVVIKNIFITEIKKVAEKKNFIKKNKILKKKNKILKKNKNFVREKKIL